MKWVLWSLLLGLLLAGMVFSVAARDIGLHLLFGWWGYLGRVLPNISVRWDGVVSFVVALGVFVVLLHPIVAWLRREMSADRRAQWRWRSTCLLAGLVIILFVAGVAMVGVTHQVAWLATDDAPLLVPSLEGGYGTHSAFNLKHVGLGIHNFHDANQRLPTPHPTMPDRAECSWITHIFPFVGLLNEMDRHKPWDHPDNRREVSKIAPVVLNPAIRPTVLRDANGYGVTHYAGNTHLFDHPEPLTWGDITDGSSNTLMVGEIVANFPPWARPRSNRDPSLGINRSPDGFGGPSSGGADFLMADGSVRFFSRDTDPTVLKALASPYGGERLARDK